MAKKILHNMIFLFIMIIWVILGGFHSWTYLIQHSSLHICVTGQIKVKIMIFCDIIYTFSILFRGYIFTSKYSKILNCFVWFIFYLTLFYNYIPFLIFCESSCNSLFQIIFIEFHMIHIRPLVQFGLKCLAPVHFI